MAKRSVYWDSCCFIGLINREADKYDDCRAVWQEVEAKKTTLYTSFLTFGEVFKVKCDAPAKVLGEDDEDLIARFLRQEVVNAVVVDERVGVLARKLMRRHPECKKPNDGLHLATALLLNVDEMHTYDGSDLIVLSEQVKRADGKPLVITKPKTVPAPPPAPAPLLEQVEAEQANGEAVAKDDGTSPPSEEDEATNAPPTEGEEGSDAKP